MGLLARLQASTMVLALGPPNYHQRIRGRDGHVLLLAVALVGDRRNIAHAAPSWPPTALCRVSNRMRGSASLI